MTAVISIKWLFWLQLGRVFWFDPRQYAANLLHFQPQIDSGLIVNGGAGAFFGAVGGSSAKEIGRLATLHRAIHSISGLAKEWNKMLFPQIFWKGIRSSFGQGIRDEVAQAILDELLNDGQFASYDFMGRPLTVEVKAPGGAVLNQKESEYKATGDLLAIRGEGEGSYILYNYDELRRMVKETELGGVAKSYSYDNRGNCISLKLTRNGQIAVNTAYTYDRHSRLVSVSEGCLCQLLRFCLQQPVERLFYVPSD